jgi:cysteine desulfurase/selenocysteine lyase
MNTWYNKINDYKNPISFSDIYLDKYNICVRSGDHCDKKLSDEIGIKNVVRISLYLYNTFEECDRLIEALNNNKILEESLGV